MLVIMILSHQSPNHRQVKHTQQYQENPKASLWHKTRIKAKRKRKEYEVVTVLFLQSSGFCSHLFMPGILLDTSRQIAGLSFLAFAPQLVFHTSPCQEHLRVQQHLQKRLIFFKWRLSDLESWMELAYDAVKSLEWKGNNLVIFLT